MSYVKPVIAITGGMACGKSTITRMFADIKHCFVVSADEVSRQVTVPGRPAYFAIIEQFGEGILSKTEFSKEGLPFIDRKLLRDIVFDDEEGKNHKLELLEQIVLPYIDAYTEELFDKCEAHYILWDVPLLYEKELYNRADEVIVIRCDRCTRIVRALERDPTLTLKTAANIMNNQATDEERESIAKYILINDRNVSLEQLAHKVLYFDKLIMEGIVQKAKRSYFRDEVGRTPLNLFPEFNFKSQSNG